jgi:hypothetical protein
VTATRVILDTSAVLKYAAGSINVGEVLAEVADEAARFAVLACLIEAARQMSVEELAALYVLEAHKHGTILAGRSDQWRVVAGLARALGRSDLASALVAAHENSAYVLTGEPQAYGDPGGDVVITI